MVKWKERENMFGRMATNVSRCRFYQQLLPIKSFYHNLLARQANYDKNSLLDGVVMNRLKLHSKKSGLSPC
jgi:hypothetical protein